MSIILGLAACSALVNILNSGDHMISMDDLYGGSNRLFRKVIFPKNNIETTFVDLTDVEKVCHYWLKKIKFSHIYSCLEWKIKIKTALRPGTKLIWIETPTNPTLKLVDVQAVADIAHQVITTL